ncbi:hypothetical protein Anapl_13041 [Anas platyrhynchos]|uniref:Uncharacterized protein n=1 Tax=Anas platyrhynchos TaxID=8839 RepID=R0JAS6_ANAPL|nr:hypothetical protein Anapl_13041 [Anas platyrhynchos]
MDFAEAKVKRWFRWDLSALALKTKDDSAIGDRIKKHTYCHLQPAALRTKPHQGCCLQQDREKHCLCRTLINYERSDSPSQLALTWDTWQKYILKEHFAILQQTSSMRRT